MIQLHSLSWMMYPELSIMLGVWFNEVPCSPLDGNKQLMTKFMGFPGGSVVKNPPANAEDVGNMCLILGWGRSPGEGNGNPIQYPCLENPMDRGPWRPIVHGATELDTAEHT